MKKLWILACLFAILPVSAFASQRSKTVNIDQQVQLAGKQLKAGHYKLKWNDSATNAATKVTFMHNGKVVATVPARIVHKKNTQNATFQFNDASGTNKLTTVYFSKERLDLGQGNMKQGS